MEKPIEFETHINEKEYVHFNFYAFYTTKLIIYIILLAIFITLSFLFAVFTSTIKFQSNHLIVLFVVAVVGVYLPFIVYRSAKKNYHLKGARFVEKMNYTIDNNWINIKGESFETKMNWEKVLQVKETKKWFLIYETKVSAHIINKRFLTENNINDLRILFDSIPNVKTKLKSN